MAHATLGDFGMQHWSWLVDLFIMLDIPRNQYWYNGRAQPTKPPSVVDNNKVKFAFKSTKWGFLEKAFNVDIQNRI